MPTPAHGVAVPRPELAILAKEHADVSAHNGYVGLAIMPIWEAVEQSAEFPYIPLKEMFKDRSTRRAPRSGYSRGDYKFDFKSYSCAEDGTEEPIDDRERKLYKKHLDADEVATERATGVLLRNHEIRVQKQVQNSNNAPGKSAIKVTWNDRDNSNPREDVKQAKREMLLKYGLRANAIVLSYEQFYNVLECKDLKERLSIEVSLFLKPIDVQKHIVAKYLDIENVLIGDAIKDEAPKGKDFKGGTIWSDDTAHLMRLSNGGKDLTEPCWGRTFVWEEDGGWYTMESYREEAIRSDVFRIRQSTGEEIIFKAANWQLEGINADVTAGAD